MSDRQQRIEALYDAALARPPEARAAFLAEASGRDETLRRDVESLLGYAAADSFLEQPALQPVPRLVAGQTLGHYTVVGPLGKGGMGEVYRAKDTRLPREVAIKVLPSFVAADPERRKRFEREARAISSLNHPNICTLHDIGEEAGVSYLVLELVEGETLADRLAKGPLAIDQAFTSAIEIASALDRAHRQGIVHRDLKPGNIMLTKTGTKLLDFGLATFRASAVAMVAPTWTGSCSATGEGQIVGTPQYMAPEQLEGKEADARTDIFAFGAVLYEMLTGRKAFAGESEARLIGAILRDEPVPVSIVQPTTPASLERLLRACLAKSPEDRWQTAADLGRQLRWVADDWKAVPPHGSGPSHTEATRRSGNDTRGFRPVPWLLGCGLAVALAFVALWNDRRSVSGQPGTASVVKTALDIAPADALLGANPAEREARGARRPNHTAIAFSPDGRFLVFAGERGGVQQLFLRAMDRNEATPIPDTQGGDAPFFSPDGLWLGFWARQSLRRVRLDGTPSIEICRETTHNRATWAENDVIVFGGRRGLMKVAATGGKAEQVTTVDRQAGEGSHVEPFLLPGGNGILYTAGRRVVAQSFDGRTRRVVADDATDARYVPAGRSGYVLFVRSGTLLAATFNPSTFAVGTPVSLVDDVMVATNTGFNDHGEAQYALSANGHLAYLTGGAFRDRENSLYLTDRRGNQVLIDAPKRPYLYVNLAPDGIRFVTSTAGRELRAIWTGSLLKAGSLRVPLEGRFIRPIFSRDGKSLVVGYGKSGTANLHRIALEGAPVAERLLESQFQQIPGSWGPNGDLFYTETDDESTDIWVLSAKDHNAHRLIHSPYSETQPALSPDGHWLAYTTDVSRRAEVVVQPYPSLSGPIPVSLNGGNSPVWTRNGEELLYLEPVAPDSNRMMSVRVSTKGGFSASPPRQLWELPQAKFGATSLATGFAVTVDGERFLDTTRTITTPPAPKQIRVVINWVNELRAKVPLGGK